MNRSILFLPLIVLAGCHHEAPKLEKTITPVRVTAVDVYQPKGGARYSATILPGRQVSLAFRVSGFVTDLHRIGGRALEPGDIVNSGVVLARLREEDYQNSSAQAQSLLEAAKETHKNAAAQVAQATASHVKAEADFARARTLMESHSVTRPDFDSAKAQLDVTSTQVQTTRAQLGSAAAQISNTEASLATARLAQRHRPSVLFE